MRVGVDIGGTFTDLVILDEESNSVSLAKALSTSADPSQGVNDAIQKAQLDLAAVTSLIHGTTVVVNAIIERNGAPTALITTRGFRDVYEIGRINRPESFNLRFRKHRPLIPRELVFEVPERMMADGTEETALDEEAAREVVRTIKEQGIEAVAVVFLHSYRAPHHEIRMCELVREMMPHAFVVSSHELSREYREYERTSTTVANAFVGPRVSSYLDTLEGRLKEDGFGGSLMIMQSNGGLYDVGTARQQCIQMMESGPAGGVVGTIAFCELLGIDAAIAFDMGGTTAKACVVRRGQPGISPDYYLGGYNEGLAIRIPVLDIVEVGTGGGSIAWIDEGKALHVGPRSAGAEPGPVCYGAGGEEPTITDANVVLGRLSPNQFLGGEMSLDQAAAAEALSERIARPLGLTMERAASGIIEIATASMANVVRQVTLERGLDPRDFSLVAYGGAGPLHAGKVARELSIGTVIVPQAPGHFSAFGMVLADLRRDYVQTLFHRLAEVEMSELEQQYKLLEEEGREALGAMTLESVAFERTADMRYVGQEHSVSVSIPSDLTPDGMREKVKALFDDAHERRFNHSAPDEEAQVVSLRLSAIGRLSKPEPPRITAGKATPPPEAQRETRQVDLDGEFIPCSVYDRSLLFAGNVISGPAVIEEAASVTLVGPQDSVRVDEYGNLHVKIGGLNESAN